MAPNSPHTLSTAAEALNWSVRSLFDTPIVRVSMLRCMPDGLGRSCEKCAVDNQLVFVTRGAFIKHTGKAARVVNANEPAFFRAAETYRSSHLDPGGDTCAVFGFSDDVISEASAGAGSACAGVDRLGLHARVLRIVTALHNQEADALALEEASLDILGLFLRSQSDDRRSGASAQALVRDVEAQLTADHSRAWSLTELSHQFRRTPFYLTRSFRSLTGVPLHRYLMDLRLGDALGRLAEGEQDLAALALDLGFASHAHFSTAFKKRLGSSPSSFRQGLVKNLKAGRPHRL